MKKCYYTIFIFLSMFLPGITVLNAAIVDELNYVNEKSDIYTYVNFSQIMQFLSSRGININDFDTMVNNGNADDTDRIIKDFGLKLTDIDELLLVMNTGDLEKKSGYIIFISFKNRQILIPEEFKKNSIRLKSGTAYKASVEQDVVFTKLGNFLVIGPAQYMDSYMEKRLSGKKYMSGTSTLFINNAAKKTVFFYMTVSEYMKKAMNTAMENGAVMAKGLKENVFIKTLLTLESVNWGMEINDKIIFRSGMQGTNPEDSERLQMLCHTWIVGSSFIVSFADLMAAKSGQQKLGEFTSDQKLMSWLHQVFGRIHVNPVNKGVVITFEMTASETDIVAAFIKKEIEKEKKAQAERLEREKITKFTRAIAENKTDLVQKYIKEKYNINGLDTDGNTPLGVSAVNGNVKIARILIENGAVVDFQNIDKMTSLHQAVKMDKFEMVTFLINKGADVNAKGDVGMTPLHYNAMQGNSEITRILIARGAHVNSADSESSTPLHYAATNGFINIVKVLVEKKADPDLLNRNDQRAIDAAAQNNHTEVVEFLKAKFRQEPKNYLSEEDMNKNYNSDENSDGAYEGADDPEFNEKAD